MRALIREDDPEDAILEFRNGIQSVRLGDGTSRTRSRRERLDCENEKETPCLS